MDANSRNTDSSHHHDRAHGLSAEETLHFADCELPGDHKGSCDQAPLHAQGGREATPARDTQGSTPFVVRVGLEAARSYSEKNHVKCFSIDYDGNIRLYRIFNGGVVCTDHRVLINPHSPVVVHP
jgi:hypothetical protein